MAQGQTTTATAATSNTTPATRDGTAADGTTGKRAPKVMTPAKAITKIAEILEQLSVQDRKRVITFITESPSSSLE